MPMMRKINAISKIQSRIRGIKGRKNYDNYQRKLYKLKYIMKKLMRFESTMILNYLAKWNMIAQQILLYESNINKRTELEMKRKNIEKQRESMNKGIKESSEKAKMDKINK